MTARELIDSIFRRPHSRGLFSNTRRITSEQLDYLYDLVGRDAEASAAERGRGKSLAWSPAGNWKYVLTEDPEGRAHTLAMVPKGDGAQSGSLF